MKIFFPNNKRASIRNLTKTRIFRTFDKCYELKDNYFTLDSTLMLIGSQCCVI